MVKLFRQNVLLQLILILVVGVGLWMPALLEGGVEMPNEGGAPLYDLLYNWLSPHPLAATLLGLALVMVEGWVLNTLLYNNKLLPQNTLLPMLCYVLLMSHGQVGLTPMTMVNLVMLVCAGQLMVPENLTITLDQLFSSACLVALASLFYLPAVTLLLPLVITFMVHSLYHWRHWVMMLLGFMAPYIVVLTVWFLTDRMHYNVYLVQCMLTDISVAWHADWGVWGLVSEGGVILLLVVSLFYSGLTAAEHTTMYRENLTTICIPLLASVIMLGYSQRFPIDMQLLALPAATPIAIWFLSRAPRKRIGAWLYDIILILFIALCF